MAFCTVAGYAIALTTVWAFSSLYVQSRRADVACAVVFLLACAMQRQPAPWLRRAEREFSRLAQWRRLWLAVLRLLALAGSALLGETWTYPHYAATLTGLVFVLVRQAMRH